MPALTRSQPQSTHAREARPPRGRSSYWYITELKKLKAVMHEMDATTWRRHWFKLRRGMLRTEQYQKLRARVVKRSGGFCESANCKRPGRHMHHVVTVYKRPDMSLDDNNVQFLCLKCHRRAHK